MTNAMVYGWSYPPKKGMRNRIAIYASQEFHLLSEALATALEVRAGADDGENTTAPPGNDCDVGGSTHTKSNDEKNAMKELRKKWSDEPAVPSIAWPVNGHDPVLGEDPTLNRKATKAIIMMDGFCPFHGQYLSHTARHVYGAAVIHILSDFMSRYLYQVQGETSHLSSRMPDLDVGDDVKAWLSNVPKNVEICGIYCESDSGLDDAERLGVALGLHPRCHDGVNTARRDKYLMNQVVSELGGLDVVKQRSCKTLEEAEQFARDLGLGEARSAQLAVVKPLRGVASDDVHLCPDLPSVRKCFDKILGSPVFGSSTAAKHEQVLVQEFATGTEYVADVVCRDGERKVAALWRYDKRAVNDAPFVYHATELVSVNDGGEVEKEVCNYIFQALASLGVRWGLSHVEVIAERSPETGKVRVRLVEVNCRQHNADFMRLANACVGYNALDMVLSAHLGSNDSESLPWDEIPVLPTTRAFGAIVHFVCHVEGNISSIRYDILEQIEDLESVMDMHVYPQFMEVGNSIERTVDIRSDSGWAHIINDDEEQFRRDFTRLVELQKEMFEVEDKQ